MQDEGDPLPEEDGAPADDPEARVLLVLERLALSLGTLDSVEYTLYRFPD